MAGPEITPKYDSTLGLIFRLNNLWAKVDIPAEGGDYEAWNNVLDRLYNNLAYRGKTKVTKDTKGNIIGMKIEDDDDEEYQFLSKKVNIYRQRYKVAVGYKVFTSPLNGRTKKVPNKKIALSELYKSLNLKDIWLRKFMNKLNLYIKETTKTPGSVMWGGKK